VPGSPRARGCPVNRDPKWTPEGFGSPLEVPLSAAKIANDVVVGAQSSGVAGTEGRELLHCWTQRCLCNCW
jgi:hypothetical protein